MSSCAVLVDAENIPYHSLSFVLEWLKRIGCNPLVRKAYGDWNKSHLSPYKRIATNLSFTMVPAPSIVSGKDTSDAAMIVGAMDILYTNPKIHCFALVTSDSDFTPLVTRLGQAKKVIYGFGMQQTCPALIEKYQKFVYLDQAPKAMRNQNLNLLVSDLIIQRSGPHGWALLSALGQDFNCKQYGYKTVSKYFDANSDWFQLDISRQFVRIHLSKDRVNHLGNLIVSCHGEGNWAPIKDLEATFDARLYGYDGMKNLLDDFPERFVQMKDKNNELLVRNKVPDQHVQKLKRLIEFASEDFGYTDLIEDVEPYFQIDLQRFGFETLKDLVVDHDRHFEVDICDTGWVKVRS